jgi:hypothetical protein
VGFLDRIFGQEEREPRARRGSDDEQALERYRYLLRTAPPEAIEQVHAEAFAQLSPEQRRQVLDELGAQVPTHERAGASDEPRSLARMATRAELRQPGTLERTFGGIGGGGGPGFGSMFASTLLGSIAGYVIGSAIADQFFDHDTGYADASAGGHEQDGFQPEQVAADGGFESNDWGGGDIDVSDI